MKNREFIGWLLFFAVLALSYAAAACAEMLP
jgi:hypothetical protein